MSSACPFPHHVPPQLVHDVDLYHLEGADTDPFEAWRRVQRSTPDVYYTPHYGGYWVLNRAELIEQVLSDPVRFSSLRGTVIPEMPPEVPNFPPVQLDPPTHGHFRQPYNIALSPARLPPLAQRAREVVIECIERFQHLGECEFMNDVAMHVPVTIVMQVLDLPFEDRERLFPLVDVVVHSQDMAERGAATQGIMAYVAGWVAKRTAHPGDDLISRFLAARVGDRPTTPEEVIATITLLILGGLDSVSHTMGFFMRFLAESAPHRRTLAAHPEKIPDAVEELLRRHSLSNTSRTVTQDCELGGVQMKRGDRIQITMALHGLDEAKWPDAMRVDFDRKPRELMTFGKGIHRCVGANLARAELRALLEEWFKRIPEFTLKPGAQVVTKEGQNLGVLHLPLSWPLGPT